ncbi:MAG: glycosyltransferase [Candidatus Paceibacterota bacterium]|jgi:glycosyltransferase involved in cell wall biosynthesis/thymidylate kinase
MKKINIAIFVDGDFIPSYDGASNRFHYLSRHLALNDVNVVIFHGYRKWSDISLIKKEPFKTYIFPIKNYYNNLELIASILRKESIDIIQFDNLEPILLQGVRLAQLTGTKLISEMHYVIRNLAKKLGANMSRLNEIKNIEKEVGRSIDHLICLSDQDKPSLMEYMKIRPELISVIPSGVDCKELKYNKPNFTAKNIVFLGNLYFKPNEDAVRVIRNQIYPELQKHGFRFTIAGDCPPNLKKECTAPSFSFIGTIPDLNQLFKDATFALAPINEGTGMRIKLLNYLAAGIPILTTSIATAGFNRKDYFLIEDDYSKYTTKIIDLLKDKKKLTRISKKGYSAIKKYYDWNIIAKQTIRTYEKVLNTPNVKRPSKDNEAMANKEPVWLQEAIEKRRFKEISSDELPKDFSFSILNRNTVETYNLEKIIALEGMPGAGKTTFIKNYVSDEKKLFIPQLQIEDEKILNKDNLETSRQFLIIEKNKTDFINNIDRKYSEVILDRTFITTLAYCYARSKVNNTPNEYKSLLEVYEKVKHTITFPTHLIYLDVSIEESLKRREIYSKNIKYKNWFDPTFLGYFKEFYKNELKKFLPIKISYIDTTDLKMREVKMKIKEIICNKKI